MKSQRAIGIVLVLTGLVAACTRAKPEPSATVPLETVSPSPTSLPTEKPTEVAPSGTAAPPPSEPTQVEPSSTPIQPAVTEQPPVCELVAKGNLMAYERPSVDARVFATLPPTLRVRVEAVTGDGWVGFDPGYAQAGNVGLFRLRWVRGGGAFALEGACEELPEVAGPAAGVCFTMAVEETPVYAQSDTASVVIATLQHADYARVLGVTDGWLFVDLCESSLELDRRGWIARDLASFNGPCEGLLAGPP